MMTTFLENIPPALAAAVGSALLHFIWQGALVALGLALALRGMRKASAEVRYALCVGAAVLLLLLPMTTAVQSYVAPPQVASGIWSTPAGGLDGDLNGDQAPEAQARENAASSGPAGSARQQSPPGLDRWDILRFILLQGRYEVLQLWLYLLPLFVLRLGLGMYGISRLRRQSFPVVDPVWLTRLEALKTRVNTPSRVRLAVSEAVSQPALLGWLRPMIVVPASLFAGVPVAHVEALLVHELTHIRRHDALVMYLQALLETLFFYHPAVWWVSRRLRIEREYACDAAAVEVLGDDLTYVRALAGLEERRGPALALGAADGRLVDRIRRIVTRDHHMRSSARTPWWVLGTVVVLATSLVLAACSRDPGKVMEGTPDDLYLNALESVQNGDFLGAKQLAEQSAEAGNLCGMAIMAELYSGHLFHGSGVPDLFRSRMTRLGQDSMAAKAWADRMVETLSDRAESGDGDAMVWLAARYDSNWFFPGYWRDDKNDSLARMWRHRAREAGQTDALRGQAGRYADEGRLAEADALYEKLGAAGDGYAYWFWAMEYMDTRSNRIDPERHFEIASLALENAAEGVHEWLGEELRSLQQQVDSGNPESIAYMAIVERLDLVRRLANTPEKPYSFPPFLPPLCEGQKRNYASMLIR